MGLDMYLYGSKFNYIIDEKTKEIKNQIIKTEEIYWRKANHIHKWFVDNVQEGHDNCLCHEFQREDLIELKNACAKVLENRDMAKDILPTQSGFFFGSTDYDEYYFEECRRTVEEIERILAEENYSWFEYHSSW